MKGMKLVSYSYHMIFYFTIDKWGPVIFVKLLRFVSYFCINSGESLAETILSLEDTPSKEEYASQFTALFIHFLFMNI